MMDALSAPTAPVSSPVVQQGGAGTRADLADEGSFSKVLSNSGNQDKGTALKDEQPETTADDADTVEQVADTRTKRPIIDLSATATTTAASGEAAPALADLSTDDLARLLAAARSKTKGTAPETEAAGKETATAESPSKAELAKALTGSRDKKTATDDQTTGTDSADPTVPEDAKGADLSDVLRLLSGATSGEAKANDETVETQEPAKGTVEQKTHAVLPDAVTAVGGNASNDTSGAQDEGADADRTFRVVKADGKGQPMILQNEVQAGAEDTGESAAVETITVLDARRFIAPASTTNGASITAAMLGDTEWVSAMSPGSELANAASQSSQGKVVNTLKLQMNPIELGSVTATLRLSGEELSVQLTVDNPAALRQLSNDTSDILKGLRAQGLTVDHVQVNMQVSSSDRSADAGQNNTSGQQTGQQTFQSGGQGSDARARGEASSSTRTTDERVVVQQVEVQSADVRSARPDQLYL